MGPTKLVTDDGALVRLSITRYFSQNINTQAALAQLVEHRIRNAGVACSSHAGGTIIFNPS